MKIGYSRVSTKDQNLDRQIEALTKLGCEKIFCEKVSGKTITARTEFKKMMDIVREGDTIIIESFSRLSRSTSDLLKIVEELNKKGVELISNKEKLDTTTATGKLQLTMLSALVQYEREIMLERQSEGLAIAKTKGVTFGRPKTEITEDFKKTVKRVENKQITNTEAIKLLGLTKSTYYRLLKEYEQNLHTTDF